MARWLALPSLGEVATAARARRRLGFLELVAENCSARQQKNPAKDRPKQTSTSKPVGAGRGEIRTHATHAGVFGAGTLVPTAPTALCTCDGASVRRGWRRRRVPLLRGVARAAVARGAASPRPGGARAVRVLRACLHEYIQASAGQGEGRRALKGSEKASDRRGSPSTRAPATTPLNIPSMAVRPVSFALPPPPKGPRTQHVDPRWVR